MQSLETVQGIPVGVSLGDLLEHRIDRVRLWQGSNHQRTMVREVSLPKRSMKVSTVHGTAKKAAGRTAEAEIVNLLNQINDPDMVVDLTLDMESGVISLAVEMEPALVGEDLSALAKGSSQAQLPVFEDEPFDSEYWSAEEAARYFGVAKSTITRRIRSNELIGFKLLKNALYVPREQIYRQKVIKGIADILAMFDFDHREAWRFLSSSVFYGDASPRPIDKLRVAKTDLDLKACLEVLKAAKRSINFGDHI